MSSIDGMLKLDKLSALVKTGEIDTVLVMFTDPYGRFMGKRFDAGFFLESVCPEGAHVCDYLLTVDMEMQPVPGYEFANWELGYGDVHLVPDMATLRVASWLPKSVLVLCDVKDGKNHAPVVHSPRSLLRRQVDKVAKIDLIAQGASELEFYIFETSYREAAKKNYHGLTPAGWYIEDYHMLQGSRNERLNGLVRHHLRCSGIPVESSKGEWGVGQNEINIRYTNVLGMADRHAIYKQCIKEVAEPLGLSVTFMAKYTQDQAGSSCHIHLSLWKDGQNAFPGDKELGPVRCSDLFRWFLAGWIAHVPDVMVFYAPTVNSYKRYQVGSWAPTRLAWCYDNRTAGFRVVGSGQSLRIECRLPGADCNPYLAYAAVLASGLDGIAKKMEPPPMFQGDAYQAKDLKPVPSSLREATQVFEKSEFARGVFGETVVKHYAHFFRTELAAFDSSVTDWERLRYFERI